MRAPMRGFLACGVLVLGLLLASPAGAVPIGAGASGQCYDTESNGGGDEVRVALDTDSPGSARVVVLSGTGAAMGLAELATAPGTTCTNGDTLDYLEVDARAGDTFVQACYDGTVRADGGCPLSPAGPGLPG